LSTSRIKCAGGELSTSFFENTKMHRVCENKKGKTMTCQDFLVED